MAKSVHPKKKRITHIANLSDSNFESDTGSMLLGCFDYVDSIMKEMDSGIKSVDCNNFYRQDASAINPRAQKNKEQNPVTPYSDDPSQNVKNAASKFKKLTAARKFPLMEKSQKVLKQLKHNRSIPKQRAHLATIPASPVKKNSAWYSSELLQRKVKADQKKRVLPKKITCSKKTASYPTQNSKNLSKSEAPQYCSFKPSIKHSDIQNKIKESTNNKSKVQHSGIKERAKSSADSEANIGHIIDKKTHASTHQKIDGKIQLYSVQENLDCHLIEKTSTKDDETTDSEYERFVQNNKTKFYRETIIKPKKKSIKKRNASKKKSKRTKASKLVIYESDQSDSNCRDDSSHGYVKNTPKKLKCNYKMSIKSLESTIDESETNLSITKEGPDQTESIFQSEKFEANCSDNSSDYTKNVSNKRKNNCKIIKKSLKLTNDESETNLSMSRKALETETIFQSEQYDSNCIDSSSDSGENILKKQNYNFEVTTKLIESTNDEPEINLTMLKENPKRIMKKESIFQSDQYHLKYIDDSSDYVKNLLNKQNKHKTITKSFESTNDESENNLSENSRISMSDQKIANFKAYQVEGSTIQNDCSALKENKINMSCASENGNLSLCKFEDISIKQEDLVKQTHVIYSKDSAKVDVVNTELSMNDSFQSHLEKQKNLNSTSSDILGHTVDSTNYNKYKSSETSILIYLSSSDTETETVESLASSAAPIVENSKIVNLQNTATNSEDSDLEIIEVISVPNRKEKVETLVNENCSLVDSHKFPKIVNIVKDFPEIKYSQTLVNINEKHIKKENKVQSHSAVYKTNICKDELLNSISGYCKSETSISRSDFFNSTVPCEDDIMIIDPVKTDESCQVQVKKEIYDNDVIIDAVVHKCQNSNMKPIISVVNSVSQNENSSAVTKELNPMNMLNCSLSHLENLQKNISRVNRPQNTNVQNMNHFKQLKSGIKNESSICSKNDFQTNSLLIEKEMAYAENSAASTLSIEGILHNEALDNSAVLHLIDAYKREFNIYKEIVRTEENVEVGLKFVEAHQAEKLNRLRSVIQRIVKSDHSFNNIYSNSLLNSKEKNDSYGTVKSSTPNRVQTPECYSIDAFEHSPICISQGLSTIVSGDVSSCIQDIPYVSSTAVKTEILDKKPDVSKLINPQIQETIQNFKSEIGFMLNTSNTTTYSDLQSEEKQEIKLFGKNCDVCGKEAVAACQGCAKAFFCSHKCGKKYWNEGHGNVCGK